MRAPGVIGVLVDQGALAADDPGVAQLAALAGGITAFGSRLDQIGWWCIRDAQIALRAVSAIGDAPAPLADAMRSIRTALAGRGGSLVTATAQAACATLLATPGADVDAALVLVTHLYGEAVATECRPFAASLDRTALAHAHLDAIWALALAARGAGSGWTAYHAHRRLPSDIATHAARAVVAASTHLGRPLAPDALAWALELAAAPLRVRLVYPESAVAAVSTLREQLAHHAIDECRIAAYPTGDPIVRFCHRALVDCDAVVAVVTAGDNSVWLRRELAVQYELFGEIRPRVILALAGARPESSELATAELSNIADIVQHLR
ncbi:MAG TPA: hypothetical protein VFV99_09585 [Kofleriaceae bacterium]|nr:hypothetical protein [Kofleriaceae bacterium]